MKRLAIIANGDFPTSPTVLEIIRDSDCVVCCDGAADSLYKTGIEPSYIVGDLDSISDRLRKIYSNKIIEISDQDFNDLSKAFYFAISLSPENIIIVGATGKREDHTIANISLLVDFSRIAPTQIISDYGTFFTIDRLTSITAPLGSQVSIFAIDQRTTVISEGLRYPLDGVVLDSWWKGSLNETVSETFSISVKYGTAIVYISPLTVLKNSNP